MVQKANPYEEYRKQGVLMANPLELIIMLYNGCIKKLKLAKMAIQEKKYETANSNFHKAQNIIMELIMSLDLNYEISKELLTLYEYIHRRIIEVNIAKDENAIDPLIEILSNLCDTWTQVEKEYKTRMANETYEN